MPLVVKINLFPSEINKIKRDIRAINAMCALVLFTCVVILTWAARTPPRHKTAVNIRLLAEQLEDWHTDIALDCQHHGTGVMSELFWQ